jgi:hypothetical protein
MAGRPAKPIEMHILQGGKHLTKDEIAQRKKTEAALKSNTRFKASDKVKANYAAFAMFKKLKRLYRDIDYVEGLDGNVINRYCLLSAETDALETLLTKMNEDIEMCDKPADRIDIYTSIRGVINSLNKSRDMLIKLEDRLFLNPTSRVKNVPKKEPPKQEPAEDSDERKFGYV